MGMSDVTLSHFDGLIAIEDPHTVGVHTVRSVVVVRSMVDVEAATPGAIVVIDPSFGLDISSYRFDLALRTFADGVVAVLTQATESTEPSITARRIAQDRQIALGHLLGQSTAISLALHLQGLQGEGTDAALRVLDLISEEIDRLKTLDAVPDFLQTCSRHLGAPILLTDRTHAAPAVPLRRGGLVKHMLVVDAEEESTILRSAIAQIARHLEDLYEADYEARELPEVTRSELFNEILLSDSTAGADAVHRLRNSDFPIDGSHLAIRVDCHEPLPLPTTMSTIARCQARIAEIFLTEMRHRVGQWTQAGTTNSILLISTVERSHSEMVSADLDRTLRRAIAEAEAVFGGLRIHVGMGTPHPGAPGFRTSVAEATTAARTARARRNNNEVEHFDHLGLGRALVRWAEIEGVRPVIDEIMQPLIQQPSRQAREAVTTLRTYLDTGQSISRTAESLHLHRNTIRYRIERIAEILTVDIDNPDERLLLELSCRVVGAEML